MSEDPGPKPTKCEKPHTQPDVTHWEPLDPEAHEQALQIGAPVSGPLSSRRARRSWQRVTLLSVYFWAINSPFMLLTISRADSEIVRQRGQRAQLFRL